MFCAMSSTVYLPPLSVIPCMFVQSFLSKKASRDAPPLEEKKPLSFWSESGLKGQPWRRESFLLVIQKFLNPCISYKYSLVAGGRTHCED